MNKKASLIAREFKKSAENRHHNTEIKLFGSSARGDSTDISDIDIMVRLPEVNREIEEDLFNIAYELELKFDCLIDVIAFPENMDRDIPIYANIEKEGLSI